MRAARIACTAAVAGFLLVAAGSVGVCQQPLRRAVVIGNSAYTAMPPLPGCESSARLAAAGLRRAGFEVTQLANPGNARLGAALAGLAEQAAGAAGTRAVVYVCGYVSPLGGRLFLLPVEASVSRDAEVLSQGIVARVAFGAVGAPEVDAGLLLVDGEFRPGAEGQSLAALTAPLSRQGDSSHAGYALSLGAMDPVAPGRLAAELAEALNGGGLEVKRFLEGLAARPGRGRATLKVEAAQQAGWLAGEPAPVAPAVAAAVTPPQAAVAVMPPQAAVTPPQAAVTAAPPAPSRMDEAAELSAGDRRLAQLELQRLGYYRGRVDGQFGPDTLVAIRQFQKDLPAPASGTLTNAQASRLLRR